jgi:hypothetical protein
MAGAGGRVENLTKSRGWILLITLLVLLPQLSAQKLPWHPKQDALAGVERVLLVPPDVRVEEWTATTGREGEGTADYVRRLICGNLDQLFEEKKLEVSNYFLCLGEGEASVETQGAVRAVQEHFRELVTAWAKSSHGETTLEGFHLGAELPATRKLGVDALVVVCANGTLTSKGERAISAVGASGGPGGQGLSIQLGVIRPQNGELVFFTQKNIGGDFLKHEDRLEKAIEKSVQAAFGPAEAPAKSPSP